MRGPLPRRAAGLLVLVVLAGCGDPEVAPAPLPDGVSSALAALLDEVDGMSPETVDERITTLAAQEPHTTDALVLILRDGETTQAQRGRALVLLESLGPSTAPGLISFFLAAPSDRASQRAYVALRHILPPANTWVARAPHPFSRRWSDADIEALAPYEAGLLDRVRDGSGPVRRYAVLLLAALPPGARTEASVPLLADALMDEDESLVSDAACALIASAEDSRHAVPRLLRLLDGPTEGKRDLALSVLERIGHHTPDVATAFLSRAESTDDDELRCSLLVAMSGMGANATDVLPLLDRELRSGDPERMGNASNCLRALPGGMVVLVRALRDGGLGTRIAAARSLGRYGAHKLSDDARRALVEAMASPDPDLEETASTALRADNGDD